ncbi:MAG TPA: Uma2 family endonuclease [Leptolyngbyaceae cyanobacterium M65_K2018_010]|nr:Uma2 family endonuclease [Leptolyngbyaceae cyanobacterium M65_K2018_010]
MVLSTQSPLQTDTWVKATWDDFVAVMEESQYEGGRGYFDHGWMRIEMSPLGAGHGRQNTVIAQVIGLYGLLKNIRVAGFTHCSFYKTGERGCQPDLAFYIGDTFQLPPQDNAPIDIDTYGPPTLVIEIGASPFKDDLGAKRLLYERLGVSEYWVVDVTNRQVIAFGVAAGRSGEIHRSEVLPGLAIDLVEEALHRSQTEDDSALMRWLMDSLR